MEIIDSFNGKYRFLSNFYECNVHYEGITYPSSEHAYQAAKSINPEVRKYVAKLPSPSVSKRFGSQIYLRDDWDYIKLSIMRQIVFDKFAHNTDLKNRLLATNSAILIEGNTWNDTYWGMCDGVGDNNLGTVLMQLRSRLKHNTAELKRLGHR